MFRVLRGIAWPGRPCHGRGRATRLRVADAARRWSAVKDGWYQSVHHLAMVATKRVGEERLRSESCAGLYGRDGRATQEVRPRACV
jgi:hypothetical protein